MLDAATRDALRRLTLQAFTVRVLAVLAIHFFIGEELFAPDHRAYNTAGRWLAETWWGENPTYFSFMPARGPYGYYYIVGAIYFLLGPVAIIVKLVNAALGAAVVPLTFHITRRIAGNTRAALVAAGFVAWFPSLILWSALNIRDVWILVLILLIVHESLVLNERFAMRPMVVAVLSTVALITFRKYILLPLTVPIALAFAVGGRENVVRNAVLAALACLVIAYADQTAGPRHLRTVDLVELQYIRHWNAVGAQSQFGAADISTAEGALVYLPIGLAYFLLSPFPWNLTSVRQVLAVPETAVFYLLIPSMVIGAMTLFRRRLRSSLPVLLVVGTLTIGYAIGEGNAGTAYRHRAQLLPFYLMLAAVGLEVRRVGAKAMRSPLVPRAA